MRTPNSKSFILLCAEVTVMLLAATISSAQSDGVIPPPLSVPRAEYFKNNPEAWRQFLSELPQQPAEMQTAAPTAPTATPKFGGAWTALPEAPGALANPLLLTDGTVIVSKVDAKEWFK